MTDMNQHPVILYDDLYAEDPRAPQTQFVPERQVAFLEALAVSGSVRAAARRVKVSHQTCYRARRDSPAFGRAWDAALVIARARVEAKLAHYAMDGVREEVWYHGELVGYRTRFSERLLLAHLARLDRMRIDDRIEALAEDFDAMLDRMRRGEGIEEEARAPAEAGASGEGAMCEEAPALASPPLRVAGDQVRVPAEAGTSGGGALLKEAPACAGDQVRVPAEAGTSGVGARHEEAPACAGAHEGAGDQARVPAQAGTSGVGAQPLEAPAFAGASRGGWGTGRDGNFSPWTV